MKRVLIAAALIGIIILLGGSLHPFGSAFNHGMQNFGLVLILAVGGIILMNVEGVKWVGLLLLAAAALVVVTTWLPTSSTPSKPTHPTTTPHPTTTARHR